MKYKMLHTCIRVKDLEASVKFYQEALGFEVSRRRDFPEDQFTLVFMRGVDGDHEIELTYNYDHPGYDIGNGFSHLAVRTEDLYASHQAHREAGYRVSELGGLRDSTTGFYFIDDPDGYSIEIIGDKK